MLTSRLLFAALTLLTLTSLLPAALSQTATPPGNDPTPPEIPGSVTDRSGATPSASQLSQLNSITNFVIVPFGAQSFDSIMGTFPGANGINACLAAGNCPVQKDSNGNAYQYLPPFTDSTSKLTLAPGTLPNRPYDVMDGLPGATLSTVLGNPSHSFFQQKFKYNGGAMDGFVAYGGSLASMSMGYYNLSKYAPNNGIFALAKQYTLFDRFHAASFGDSVAQHLYFIGGSTIPFNASMPGQCPADLVAQYNTTMFPQTFTNGSGTYMTSWTQQPPLNRQCYFIGELNSQNLCSGNPPFLPEIPNSATNPKQIGDVFDSYNQQWAWYAEDFVAAEAADCMQSGPRQFNVHDQPWQHYTTFHLNNSAYWQTHQKDSTQFWTQLAAQTLEPLTWYVPSQVEDFGWSNNSPAAGNAFVDAFVANITASALWKANKLAVIYTWVGPSGLMDHVAPPKGDTYGPGGRVATIFMSPFHTSASKAINSDVYEHYSIYKMIARRFGMDGNILKGIWGNARYMAAADLTMSFPGNGNNGGNGASAVSVAAGVVVAVVLGMVALLL